MNATYILDSLRSPIAAFGGSLANTRPDDLLALVMKKLLERNPNIDPSTIEDIFIGCANQAGEDNRNIARMASLLAGIPMTVPAETINRLCASGMSAVCHAHHRIQSGDGELYLAGGVENMTRAPWVISKTSTAFGRDAKMFDSSFGWRFINPALESVYGCDSMGETAENLAEKYSISREDQDKFAFHSQMKAKIAIEKNRFVDEILPIPIMKSKTESFLFSQDEFPKPNTTLEILQKLKAAFRTSGTVTAGNASGLNDGAAALLIASEKMTSKLNANPIARIISSAVVGVEPKIMGIGPVEASKKALQKANLTLDQMDLIEINEAFAAQVLACTRQLNLSDNDTRINPNGGAIALGHPLGMSGARLIQTASLELKKQNKKYALCTMCIGVGQGYAVVIENISL
jgi:3-oxoadipyl-CoA thiolase